MTTFADIGVRPRTSTVLGEHGFKEPNTVQQEAIPPLLASQDCVMEAPPGSGKTLAFVVPLVERLAGHQGHGARALIVTPTRELATQVNAVIRKVDPALRTVAHAAVARGINRNHNTRPRLRRRGHPARIKHRPVPQRSFDVVEDLRVELLPAQRRAGIPVLEVA